MYNFTIRHRVDTDDNILDPESLIQGYYWEDDAEIQNSNVAYSSLTPISPSTTYQGNGSSGTNIFSRVSYYDFNKRYISTFGSGTFSTFTSPSNAYYAIISVKSITNGEPDPYLLSVTEGGGSSYSPYYRTRAVYPSYKKLDQRLDQEGGNNFYRVKIDTDIKILRSDYDYLDSLSFDQQIFLDIEDSTGFFEKYTGVFYKTDCKWDEDNRSVDIKFDTQDRYTDVLGGIDKTFNIIEEAPELQELIIRRRPIIQVYIPGDKVVTNILGGTYWETEIQIDPEFDHSTLVNTYKFFNTQNIRTISTGYVSLLSTDVTGDYDPSTGERDAGSYKLVSTFTSSKYPGWNTYQYHIVEIGDTLGMGETWSDYALYETEETDWRNTNITTLVFNGVNGETGSFYFTDYKIYTRYSTDLLNVRGTDTYPVPDTDIIPNNSNYKRVIGYDLGTTQFAVYNEFVDYPTKFGRLPGDAPNPGQYYKEWLVSVVSGLNDPTPVAPSNWRAVSLWFFSDLDVRYTEFIDGQDIELRDAYPLHSVIQTLLRAMGSNVSFVNNTEYSEFLYSTVNPFGSFTYLDFDGGTLVTAGSGNLDLFITPKSNILVGDYEQPANKAEITLKQIFEMLKNVFRLQWHIEGHKLRIEHVSWYNKGGTYSGSVVGSDLTLLYHPRNNKPWSFNQNKWEYEKVDMPERFEYGWMDDVTIGFEGEPIEIESNYVQKGRIEDRVVSNFTTDMDFLAANPNEVAKDGFVLLGCVPYSEETYTKSPASEYNGETNYSNYEVGMVFTADQNYFFGEIDVKLWVGSGKQAVVNVYIGTSGSTTPTGLTAIFTKTYDVDEFNTTANTFATIVLEKDNLLPSGSRLYVTVKCSDDSAQAYIRRWDSDSAGREKFVLRTSPGGSWAETGNWRGTFVKLRRSEVLRPPYIEYNIGYNKEVVMQNGLLSWRYLHPKFHVYDLPSDSVKVNGESTTLFSNITKRKSQEVEFPAVGDVDPYALVKSGIGNGIVDKMTIDMLSRMIKSKLRHDTE